jgi:hypothetical protein
VSSSEVPSSSSSSLSVLERRVAELERALRPPSFVATGNASGTSPTSRVRHQAIKPSLAMGSRAEPSRRTLG